MLRHLEDPEIGLVNAVTNFSGNESRIHVPYTNLDGMPAFAAEYMNAHDGVSFDIAVAAMYCVGMRRDTYERIGPLDEAFGVGMFEDDDYSHRARLAGLRVVCAEDVFVHHFGQASFRKLPAEEYNAIFRRNQEHYERKWGITWRPHSYR
jgi:GT2 family glycosyltransferase